MTDPRTPPSRPAAGPDEPDPPAGLPREMGAAERGLRWILAALFYFGAAGTLAELWLLEHVESFTQVLPFLVIAAAMVAMTVALVRPERTVLRTVQVSGALVALVGALGVYLHYDGNVAFELEMRPDRQGMELLWRSLGGATPALAPGLMVQLGLLAMAFTYRHPAVDTPADGDE